MSIVRMHNKKTGITYVYESESYWDPEKKQPRNRRKLIGKVDPVSGEIIPTGRPGRRPANRPEIVEPPVAKTESSQPDDYQSILSLVEEKNAEISALKNELHSLKSQCNG